MSKKKNISNVKLSEGVSGGWNHRIMAKEYPPTGEVTFFIHEVHYKRNGKPRAYTTEPISVHGSSLKDIKWVLNKMKECTKKPILWQGKKITKEYKEK